MASKEEELNVLLSKLNLAYEKCDNGTPDVVNTLDIDAETEHDKVVSGVKSLMVKGFVTLEELKLNSYTLSEEGLKYATSGSPEYLLVQVVASNPGIKPTEASSQVENGKIGLSKALKSQMLAMDSDKGLILGKTKLEFDVTQKILLHVKEYGSSEKNLMEKLSEIIPNEKELNNEFADLKKRKLISSKVTVTYMVKKTENYKSQVVPQFTDLTSELLENDLWKSLEIKKYNFFSSGKRVSNGDFHPLVHSMDEFRYIFTSMGFEELDTSKYLESSFWCFDSLYIPQQHPARDTQDTFFTKHPSLANPEFMDENYIKNVSIAHGDGSIYNSTGWRYDWKLDEALKMVLRTHITPCSARVLKAMADEYQKGNPIVPRRFFAIDKVFRNEASDSTHLSEFHQVEGLVVGYDLGLGHLMGVLETFYKSIGITNLRYKPAYNPYTEPSMEIFGFHTSLNTWVEVGNSGIFRPEMLLPMGLPENVTVIAWGLSLERPTMLRHNIRNIRDLIGCKY
ncbi:phenylalanine-tRNA synthetase, putative [Theileria equi strain WA]|uniref:phenylalanine--tRNA ligase n=1 Tax=Theileria equi strain WA TaxID=1537102 RepID=L0B0A4_THEEQ|nr:phenylalanine-tRNA synthetase, putative [Theileria equi strain WA]AFZ81287.1 phenylalanine-tRNA synthetase, putative [Theileria equi strain WA]|eukprot:XP_004830953.1 phenylalanine-tRNA synthetase, putative [Theileria equi strain WA]